MVDREKTIKGLEQISDFFFDMYHEKTDTFEYTEAKKRCDIIEDALELLKDQEPQPLLNVGFHKLGNNHNIYYGICPNCGKKLYHKTSKFCLYCGQAVKWE